MTVKPEPLYLARVGVNMLNSKPLELQCKKCGAQWQPGILPNGHLPAGWWKCPNDPKHTIDWDTFGNKRAGVMRGKGTRELG